MAATDLRRRHWCRDDEFAAGATSLARADAVVPRDDGRSDWPRRTWCCLHRVDTRGTGPAKSSRDEFADGWQDIPRAQGQVYALEANSYFSRPGPRLMTDLDFWPRSCIPSKSKPRSEDVDPSVR